MPSATSRSIRTTCLESSQDMSYPKIGNDLGGFQIRSHSYLKMILFLFVRCLLVLDLLGVIGQGYDE